MAVLADIIRTPFSLLYKYRHVLMRTAVDTVRQRYSASMIGVAWTIIYPVLFLSIYAIVYIGIFRVKIEGTSSFDYILMMFAGLIPFLGFSEALGSGVSCIVDNKTLITNTMFPIELVPAKTVLAGSLTMLVGFGALLLALFADQQFYATQIILPVIIVLQLMFTIGLIWLLSMLNVFFRDLTTIVQPVILALMLVSPIAYTLEMIPKNLNIVMYPNPLFYLIMIYREGLCFGRVPWGFVGVFTLIALVTFFLGHLVFSRLKGICADHV